MINTVLRGEYIELSAKNKLINKSQKRYLIITMAQLNNIEAKK